MSDIKTAAQKAFSLLDRLPINEGYHDETVEVLDELRAALAQQAVPAGWKLVPVEPTPEMVHAIRFAGDPDRPAIGERIVAGETAYPFVGEHVALRMYRTALAAAPAAPQAEQQAGQAHASAQNGALAVWYGSMPESNGRSNWTAILHRGDLSQGHTINRSEYPDRVRYFADHVRWLIGELAERPDILAYDDKLHSGYVAPQAEPVDDAEALRDMLDDARAELAAVRQALGVPHEPHQSLQERTLLAAKQAAPKAEQQAEQAPVPAQSVKALAAEVLCVCASIGQHIEQGVVSEALIAAQRPGYGTGIYTYLKHRVDELRTAARAALAAQQAEREPLSQAPAPAHQDYVLELLVAAGHVTQAKVDEAREIAAKVAPAQAPAVAAEPLTDEQIDEIAGGRVDHFDRRVFARAIERAHGIGHHVPVQGSQP